MASYGVALSFSYRQVKLPYGCYEKLKVCKRYSFFNIFALMFLPIVHITLALLVFVSATGAPLFRHYCMNRVKDVSLFAKADSCQPDEKVCSIHSQKEQKSGIERKKCCKDRVDYLKISTDLSDHSQYHNFTFDVIAILPILSLPKISAESTELAHWLHYRPPPPSNRAIHILVQSFLC